MCAVPLPLTLPLPPPPALAPPLPLPLPLPLVVPELDGGAKSSNPAGAGDGAGDASPAAMLPARGAKYSSSSTVIQQAAAAVELNMRWASTQVAGRAI